MVKPKGNISALDEQLYEKTVNRRIAFEGRVFQVEVKDVELFDGSVSNREVVLHNGGATIVALDDDMNVYLVRQFRSPYEKVILETPAGKLEKGEDPRGCAIRELKEETGMEAKTVIDLGKMYATPGYCSEIIHLYLAQGLSYGEGNPDDGEFLQLVKIPLKKALEMIDSNEISDAKTMVALMKTARRVGV
ncbi:MAG: NUDIX hydrolase [Clostridiales bacterium]|nr:NUDIX hydrolase [Clostridiales bacterium]